MYARRASPLMRASLEGGTSVVIGAVSRLGWCVVVATVDAGFFLILEQLALTPVKHCL